MSSVKHRLEQLEKLAPAPDPPNKRWSPFQDLTGQELTRHEFMAAGLYRWRGDNTAILLAMTGGDRDQADRLRAFLDGEHDTGPIYTGVRFEPYMSVKAGDLKPGEGVSVFEVNGEPQDVVITVEFEGRPLDLKASIQATYERDKAEHRRLFFALRSHWSQQPTEQECLAEFITERRYRGLWIPPEFEGLHR